MNATDHDVQIGTTPVAETTSILFRHYLHIHENPTLSVVHRTRPVRCRYYYYYCLNTIISLLTSRCTRHSSDPIGMGPDDNIIIIVIIIPNLRSECFARASVIRTVCSPLDTFIVGVFCLPT